MVFQAPVLFDWRTVEDNVKLPLEIIGLDARKRDARAREMLELVELRRFLQHRPYQLSGGHAAARRDRAGARARAIDPAHGRAVRRARRDDPRADEPGAAADLGADRHDDRVRHPLDPGGGVPVVARRGDERRAPAGSPTSSTSTCRARGAFATREEPRYFELVTAVREALRGDLTGEGGPAARPAGLTRVGRPPGRRGRRVTAASATSPSPGPARLAGLGQCRAGSAAFATTCRPCSCSSGRSSAGSCSCWRSGSRASSCPAVGHPGRRSSTTGRAAGGRWAAPPANTLHRGVRRARDRRRRRDRRGLPDRALGDGPRRAAAGGDRGERGPDHRVRAAAQHLVRDHEPAGQGPGGGRAGVLPGDDQRHPRPRPSRRPRWS